MTARFSWTKRNTRGRRPRLQNMSAQYAHIKVVSIALVLASIALFASSACGQAEDPQSEVTAMKAQAAAILDLLHKLEDQQKALLEQVDRLQQRLDGSP